MSEDLQTLMEATVHFEDSQAWWRRHNDMGGDFHTIVLGLYGKKLGS